MEEKKKLIRPLQGRKLAGVCAALANYFSLDPTIVRVIYVLLTLFTAFAGVIVYLILMLIIPAESN